MFWFQTRKSNGFRKFLSRGILLQSKSTPHWLWHSKCCYKWPHHIRILVHIFLYRQLLVDFAPWSMRIGRHLFHTWWLRKESQVWCISFFDFNKYYANQRHVRFISFYNCDTDTAARLVKIQLEIKMQNRWESVLWTRHWCCACKW